MRHSRTKDGAEIQLETEIEESIWEGDRFESMRYRVSARAAARKEARGFLNRGMRLKILARDGSPLEDTVL